MRACLIIVCLFSSTYADAQQNVRFHITDGQNNAALRSVMEWNASVLLTEINHACYEGRNLILDDHIITPNAQHSLSLLWNNLHFYCEDSQVMERCLTSVNGYQVRNIPIHLEPIIEGYEGEIDRELTISFSPEGLITGTRMAMSSHVYTNIIKRGSAVDMSRREEILKFVEDFRSHYDEKDIESLRQVFSDDALIITGTVILKHDYQGDQPRLRPEIVYRTQNKQQYLSRLEKVFNANRYIKVTFSDPKVVRSGDNPNFYGVSLHQHWKSNNYEDDGYVFLLWEFRENGEPPIVHVRTWQPDKIAGKALSSKQLINLQDFDIPTKKKR